MCIGNTGRPRVNPILQLELKTDSESGIGFRSSGIRFGTVLTGIGIGYESNGIGVVCCLLE